MGDRLSNSNRQRPFSHSSDWPLRFIWALLLFPPIVLIFSDHRRAFWLTVGLGGSFLFSYSAIAPGCQWFGPVLTRFKTNKKEVWLTIDDGPDLHDTRRILEVLKHYRARATFFVVGNRVRRHPDLVRQILLEGHHLGNHSDTHPAAVFWALPVWKLHKEVDDGAAAIRAISGHLPGNFRAPAGMANIFLRSILDRREIRLVGWTARGFDGVDMDVDRVVSRILRRISPGAIVLVHEGKAGRGGETIGVRVVENLLRRLTEEGYACVIPSEVLEPMLAGGTEARQCDACSAADHKMELPIGKKA